MTLVVKDDGFSIDTYPAAKARELATAYLQWSLMPESATALYTFSKELIQSLERCIGHDLVSLKKKKRANVGELLSCAPLCCSKKVGSNLYPCLMAKNVSPVFFINL